nr:BamA/TamA family outer membrane protein [Pseudodesulfovibrio sp.]
MIYRLVIAFVLCMVMVMPSMQPSAMAFKMVQDTSDPHEGPRLLVVPFGFKTEASGAGLGIGATYSGWPQKQAIVGGAAWKSFDKTDAIYLNLTDFQLPFAKRFFVMVHGFDSSYDNMVSYASGSGGSGNSSGEKDFYKGHGWDQWVEGELTYVLPWGPFGDDIIHTYTTNRGLLTEGSVYKGTYDPSESGRSYFKIKPYYRHRWYRESTPSNGSVETGGVRFTLEYDNTDFTYDPSEGSKTMLRLYQGVDTGKSDAWTGVEFDFSKYWELGESSWFSKQVLAFNFWTVDTPSWNERDNGSVTGASPYFMGAALGGYTRQRGYPFYRFHDKAAINYAVEYRVMPKWNPLGTFNWFKWWEVVPFAEVGRVAPYWSPLELHGDMKVSAGVGLRVMILNSVLRLDMAGSSEGANVWAMINQTF